jgi:serine/threonine protein kinase
VILPERYVPSGQKFDGGGMSDAILCDDTHLSRKVVIKTLLAGEDPKRILDELRALQAISSKHVVQVYDVIRDENDKIVGIVEEYLPGDDLGEISTPAELQDYMRILFQIAEGISEIHEQGVVHRDIKRTNMKFDSEGCLKIFDFGLAREVGKNASTIGSLGTKGYMAPELFEATTGGNTRFTPAIDVYAFGITAWVIARGSIPSDLRKSPPSLPCADVDFNKLSYELPEPVAELLNRCLNKSVASRPAMKEIADLIGTHLLRDQHRALMVSDNATYVLDKDNPEVKLALGTHGSLSISYDGLNFVVSEVQGSVAINNIVPQEGFVLPGSCVIVIGPAELRRGRRFITVDVAHPEVGI